MEFTTRTPPETPIQHYINDLKRHALLSSDQEKALALRYRQENDRTAFRKLINGNLRLVVKIAKDYWNGRGPSFMDLIQEGNIGLVRAARKFDPSKGAKFSYYASFWIKAHIYKYLIDNTRTVRLGTTQAQRKLFFNLNRTKAALHRRGMPATPGEIARELNVKTADVVEMEKRLNAPDVSLNDPIPGRNTTERGDQMASEAGSIEDEYTEREMTTFLRRTVRKFKKCLTPRETAILERRILSPSPLTLRVLGERYGVSRERIRQVEKRIIEKFKAYLFSKHPDILQNWQPAG